MSSKQNHPQLSLQSLQTQSVPIYATLAPVSNVNDKDI